MRQDEDVSSYSYRVEDLYFKLCNASTLNKSGENAKIIRETIKEQALAVYIKGLSEKIKTIVKSRNPTSLEKAKQIARQEEIDIISDKEAQEYYGANKNNNGNGNGFNNNSNNGKKWNNNFGNRNYYNNLANNSRNNNFNGFRPNQNNF